MNAPQIHPQPVDALARRSMVNRMHEEIRALKDERRRLRHRVRDLERSRRRWRAEAKAWQWGALHRS